MKKIKFNFKIKQVTADQLTDRLLLLNLYLTQGLTLIIGLVWIFLQKRNPFELFLLPNSVNFMTWGIGLAAIMLLVDFVLSRVVKEDELDDGGINRMLFRDRPLWHIIVISAIVAICEELLFRGAIQYAIGPYWTSIIFALIHIRYLKHWLPTGWVFLSSYGLGMIYIYSGTIWAPILCHFLIDCISGMVIRYRSEEE